MLPARAPHTDWPITHSTPLTSLQITQARLSAMSVQVRQDKLTAWCFIQEQLRDGGICWPHLYQHWRVPPSYGVCCAISIRRKQIKVSLGINSNLIVWGFNSKYIFIHCFIWPGQYVHEKKSKHFTFWELDSVLLCVSFQFWVFCYHWNVICKQNIKTVESLRQNQIKSG